MISEASSRPQPFLDGLGGFVVLGCKATIIMIIFHQAMFEPTGVKRIE